MLDEVHQIARIARRMVRRFSAGERFYRATLHRRHVRLGGRDASFVVDPTTLTPDGIVYSFGIGTDVSFDLECISQFSVQVHAFDPTPRSIEWLSTQTLPPEFHYHEYGLADFDGVLEFYPPENPAHVSYSIQERAGSKVTCPVHRLSTIMGDLGHDHLDLLKMDIEGSEYGVIENMLAEGIKPIQLCVEFHHRWPEFGHQRTERAIDRLQSAGYGLFHVSASGEEFSFILIEKAI